MIIIVGASLSETRDIASETQDIASETQDIACVWIFVFVGFTRPSITV